MKNHPLPGSTEIDVVAKRGPQIIVKRMTIDESRYINKKKGWTYENFQIGFHSYKNSKKEHINLQRRAMGEGTKYRDVW